jgi:hypothetical protein
MAKDDVAAPANPSSKVPALMAMIEHNWSLRIIAGADIAGFGSRSTCDNRPVCKPAFKPDSAYTPLLGAAWC